MTTSFSFVFSYWQKIEAKVATVETDRKLLPADETQNVIVKVNLDAPKPAETTSRPSVNLAIVLDRSGSMTGQKLERALFQQKN